MAKLFQHAMMRRAATATLFMLFLAPSAHAQGGEGLAWARANSCESIQAFMRQYPNGQFIAQAREAFRSRGCVDREEQAKKMAEAERRRAENTENENRALRDRLAAAERRASEAERLRVEAVEKARLAAQTTPQDAELARLTSIRGDWVQSWLSSSTGPSTFRGGYYIMGASTKSGGWMSGSGYPCGGAIVRGNTWITPTASSSMKFELVYGRLPTGVTAVTHNFYHSRTTYLGATFQDAWRALSDAAYAKSGQSCGAVLDRRYVTPAPADAPATSTTPSASNTEAELTRLASIRGDWVQSWMNSDTPPATFTGGYYILGSNTKTGGWLTGSGYPCGGAIVRGYSWYRPSPSSTMSFELVYGRLPSGTTSTTHSYYHSRTTYLGTTFQDSWRTLSEAAYAKSGQSCGAVTDRRYVTPASPPSATLSVRDQVQRDIAGTWQRTGGSACNEWQSITFPSGGALVWRYATPSDANWTTFSASNWTVSYETGRLVYLTGDGKRRTLGLEGGVLYWRVDGAMNCSFRRATPPSTIR